MTQEGYIYQISVQMVTEKCVKCGVLFAITKRYMTDRKKDHETFYCPNKHGQYYPNRTDEQKKIEALKGEVACLVDCCDTEKIRADRAEASKRSHKGANTKLRNQLHVLKRDNQ